MTEPTEGPFAEICISGKLGLKLIYCVELLSAASLRNEFLIRWAHLQKHILWLLRWRASWFVLLTTCGHYFFQTWKQNCNLCVPRSWKRLLELHSQGSDSSDWNLGLGPWIKALDTTMNAFELSTHLTNFMCNGFSRYRSRNSTFSYKKFGGLWLNSKPFEWHI